MPATVLSHVIPANDYRRERWRNGAGWTREIHAASSTNGSSAAWDWRLSIAEIERDAPFSIFPGIDRELVLLRGNGLRLCFDDGETQQIDPPYGRLRFAGERAVTGELLGGRSEDFNLMWRRDAVATQLWHRPLVGPMVVFIDPGSTWVVHLLAGDARFAADADLPPMAMGDTALLVADVARTRYALEGAGEALLIRFDTLHAE